MRTKVGVACVSACLVEQSYFREAPFDLDELDTWVVVGLVTIALGSIIRLAALGCIRKKEELATTGVYSLCRHPLYLGSILIAVGFCILLHDTSSWIVAAGYFLVFYPLTILWEEIRLEERYSVEYERYRRSVPLLLPFGAPRWGATSLRRGLYQGGFAFLACEGLMLLILEVMAESFHA